MIFNFNKIKTYLKLISFLSIICIPFFLLVFSKEFYNLTYSTLNLFVTIIFPALFPFILFSNFFIINGYSKILSKTLICKLFSRFFNVSYFGASAIILGFLFGYPNGAKYINYLFEEKRISRKEANNLLLFTNNGSPAYIISSIGIGIYKSMEIGLILFTSHIFASIIIGKFSSYYNKEKKEDSSHAFIESDNIKRKITIFESLVQSIKNTVLTLELILGFMVVFNILHSIIVKLLNIIVSNNTINTILLALMEKTSGISLFFKLDIDYGLKIIMTSIFLGFSSFSILFQIYSCVYKNKFSFKNILKGKLLHGIISGSISYALIKVPYINKRIYESIIVSNNIDVFNSKRLLSLYFTNSILIILSIYVFIIILLKKKRLE
ncbi:MAG: hypothetical protein PHR25_04770 [Clostridia bacterium]|nr:hypothetical protein [Clostridia bacterium]